MPILPIDPVSGSGASSGAGAVAVGVSNLSADGIKVVFTIPHGLGYKPTHATLSSLNMLGAGDKFYTYDTTNITITFAIAPTSGTISFSWGVFK